MGCLQNNVRYILDCFLISTQNTLNQEFSEPSSSFCTYKKLIEDRFDSLKQRLKENENHLIQNHEDWYVLTVSETIKIFKQLSDFH